MKRDVAQLKDEKHLERNKNEQLNVEIEELEAKCGLYKHNTEKLHKNFELEVGTMGVLFFRVFKFCCGTSHSDPFRDKIFVRKIAGNVHGRRGDIFSLKVPLFLR